MNTLLSLTVKLYGSHVTAVVNPLSVAPVVHRHAKSVSRSLRNCILIIQGEQSRGIIVTRIDRSSYTSCFLVRDHTTLRKVPSKFPSRSLYPTGSPLSSISIPSIRGETKIQPHEIDYSMGSMTVKSLLANTKQVNTFGYQWSVIPFGNCLPENHEE